MAADVSVFDDGSRGWDAERDGPPDSGPSLAEWAEDIRAGRLNVPLAPELVAEVATLTGRTFATRRLQSAYLRWVYERAVAALPAGVELRVHRRRAVRLTGPRDGAQRVWLEDRELPLVADAVVLALGHLDAEPDEQERELGAFVARHRLAYLPPEYTADSDLRALRPGQPVLVRGFGLAFVDLMVLLTEGRGGTYVEAPGARGEGPGDGPELFYRPSGREPVLYVGSRRGVPYHAKLGYDWTGELPPLPRFFGPEQVADVLRRQRPVDFARDAWPLVQKELGYVHYHRLFMAHPERTAGSWAEFETAYAACEVGGPALAALGGRRRARPRRPARPGPPRPPAGPGHLRLARRAPGRAAGLRHRRPDTSPRPGTQRRPGRLPRPAGGVRAGRRARRHRPVVAGLLQLPRLGPARPPAAATARPVPGRRRALRRGPT